MVFDSSRKAIASLTRKVTKKGTSKKKSKDVGTSKRRRKDETSEEEEEPDNPNDSDFDPANEASRQCLQGYSFTHSKGDQKGHIKEEEQGCWDIKEAEKR
jgi:hypothetical protein